jgi:hypothetical protein
MAVERAVISTNSTTSIGFLRAVGFDPSPNIFPVPSLIYLHWFKVRSFKMLFEYLKGYRASGPSYEPLRQSRDLFVHQIYHSRGESVDSDKSLKDILSEIPPEETAAPTIFAVSEHGTFILWHVRSAIPSTNSLEDALSLSQDFIKRPNQRQISIMFSPGKHEGPPAQEATSSLTILTRYDPKLLPALGLPLAQQEKIATACREIQTRKPRSTLRANLLSTSGAITILGVIASVCAIAIFVFSTKYHGHQQPAESVHEFTEYSTEGSIGPYFQRHVTPENATELIEAMEPGEWTLRIDDQAVIPMYLLDEEEAHYQKWFQNRYTEMNRIRTSGDHMNETWLSSTAIDNVPTDGVFHVAHCVLAVRRYVKAKESGRHVCGRDIDKEHFNHCMEVLDWWAYPEGRKGEDLHNENITFKWRTKICFDQ